MFFNARRFRSGLALVAALLIALAGAPAVHAQDPDKALAGFTEEKFLDAAYDNCATVENRSAQSCSCERKLIGDRIGLEDKQMAYLYWTDKPSFKAAYEAKRKADPTFQKAFSERFSNLQALIIAACGA